MLMIILLSSISYYLSFNQYGEMLKIIIMLNVINIQIAFTKLWVSGVKLSHGRFGLYIRI